MNERTIYQSMSLGQLAARWNVSVRTVRRWIHPFREELGPIQGKLLTPRQVKIVLDHLE